MKVSKGDDVVVSIGIVRCFAPHYGKREEVSVDGAAKVDKDQRLCVVQGKH